MTTNRHVPFALVRANADWTASTTKIIYICVYINACILVVVDCGYNVMAYHVRECLYWFLAWLDIAALSVRAVCRTRLNPLVLPYILIKTESTHILAFFVPRAHFLWSSFLMNIFFFFFFFIRLFVWISTITRHTTVCLNRVSVLYCSYIFSISPNRKSKM